MQTFSLAHLVPSHDFPLLAQCHWRPGRTRLQTLKRSDVILSRTTQRLAPNSPSHRILLLLHLQTMHHRRRGLYRNTVMIDTPTCSLSQHLADDRKSLVLICHCCSPMMALSTMCKKLEPSLWDFWARNGLRRLLQPLRLLLQLYRTELIHRCLHPNRILALCQDLTQSLL